MKKVLILVFIFFICMCFWESGVLASDKVDINTATLQQLDTLTGIGPVYAQRIIDNRPYSSIDDLDNVKGIGPATLQKIKDQGLACVNCSTSDVEQTPNDQTTQVYPSGIVINEILPNPQGSDETDEYIEIFNTNKFDVDLSGWQLQDVVGTLTTFTIPTNTKISANDYLVFMRPQTKIMLNNDQDGVNLLSPDKKIVDSVTFTNAPINKSYNRTNFGWQWSQTLTPRSKNVISSLAPTQKASTVSSDLPKTKNSVKNDDVEPGLASLSQTANPWILFFTVLAITIILALAVLLIKFKIQKL